MWLLSSLPVQLLKADRGFNDCMACLSTGEWWKKTQSKTDIGSCDFFPQIWGSEGEGITQATGVW